MRFTIFTHVDHQVQISKYFAYAPYVREMNIWFKNLNSEFGIQNYELGGTVEVVAPLVEGKEEITGLAYEYPQVSFTRTPGFDLLSLKGIFISLFKIPVICFRIFSAMSRADHLHLRCPGNIGLLACIVQVFFPGKRKTAKYAGNWDPEAQQPWTYKLQKWILSNSFLTKNMTVLVYGEWPGQSNNVKPFFTASFSEKAILSVQEKKFQAPYNFIFVGNLVPGKGLKRALDVIRRLQEKGVQCGMEIYGDGPEKIPMRAYVEEAEIKGITFKGNRSLEELKQAYQKAHFVILPSKSEGWPKAVAEGMFFGCIPIVTPVSCLPWILGNGSRGMLLDGDLNSEFRIQNSELERILGLLEQPEELRRMSKEAKEWSQQYTLERFEEGIREILKIRFPADERRSSRRSSQIRPN